MDRSYHYIGCFFPKEELLSRTEHISEGHLFRLIDAPHVTFVFAPEKADESLFGEKVRVKFQPIEPLYLEGTFGGYTEGGTVVCGRPESR